jgi:hypothetical protein
MYIYEGSLPVERSHKIPTLVNEVEVQALVSRSLNSKSTDVVELKFPNPSLTHSISGCVFEAPSHMVYQLVACVLLNYSRATGETHAVGDHRVDHFDPQRMKGTIFPTVLMAGPPYQNLHNLCFSLLFVALYTISVNKPDSNHSMDAVE